MNNELIDLCSCMLRIAEANNGATDSTFIFGENLRSGIVLQTTNSVSLELSIFSIAFPERTA